MTMSALRHVSPETSVKMIHLMREAIPSIFVWARSGTLQTPVAPSFSKPCTM
jgi:hypothetical protein